ncbi:MAG: hypothetical protein EBR82_49640 [Caulobacteraceae bacterium]|nr:hypothetical protein [Caulobacteraceae bacterium]
MIYLINFSANIIEVVMYLFIALIQKLNQKMLIKLLKLLDYLQKLQMLCYQQDIILLILLTFKSVEQLIFQ